MGRTGRGRPRAGRRCSPWSRARASPAGDHERCAAHDQREREEERALVLAREQDEDRGEGDGDGTFDDELGAAQRLGGNEIVHDQDEEPGQGEQHEDGRLVVLPQAGHRDDRGRRQEEDPGDHADHAVEGLGRDGRRRQVEGAEAECGVGLGGLANHAQTAVRRDALAQPASLGQEGGPHEREVRDHGEGDEHQDRLDHRHAYAPPRAGRFPTRRRRILARCRPADTAAVGCGGARWNRGQGSAAIRP